MGPGGSKGVELEDIELRTVYISETLKFSLLVKYRPYGKSVSKLTSSL